jgi:GntR family transcriptional regulator/MocR family aminotransferase
VAIESPGYGMALELLRQHRARTVSIPMAADGLDLARLKSALETRRPALLYTMPNFHNPTGITTSASHRESLLALCERHDTLIVEDGFDEELDYAGPAALPIKALDLHGLVLYIGTLSKLVYPGLRIGWIAAARRVLAPLTALHRVSTLGGAVLDQAIAAQLLRSAAFDVHLRRMHRTYQRRLRVMLDGLASHLPSGVTWTRPSGGYLLWLTIPDAARQEAAMVARLARAGVDVTPGAPLRVGRSANAHLRLSIACVDEAAITEGCERLGEVLRGKGHAT